MLQLVKNEDERMINMKLEEKLEYSKYKNLESEALLKVNRLI